MFTLLKKFCIFSYCQSLQLLTLQNNLICKYIVLMLKFYTNLQANTKFYYILQTATHELTTTITNLLLITLIYL